MTRTDRVLGIVQAGGQGSRLDVLTRERAKPALPFAGEYQLIDFALSALARSGVPDVWVAVQYLAGTLDHHLAGGRPWDLDRTRGGLRRVVPEEGATGMEAGFATGNADSLHRIWRQIEDHDPELVVVLSADHIFSLDLRDVIDQHRERGSECTIVTSELSLEEAATKATLDVAADGTVRAVEYKPERAQHTTVSTEITVYDAHLLGLALAELRRDLKADEQAEGADGVDAAGPGPADSGLGDFGEHLLPWFAARGKTHAFPLKGYWRDVGRPEAYLGAHRDLLAGRIDAFRDPEHPVLTRRDQRPPAHLLAGSDVDDSVISVGCTIRGEVRRSVLGPGVVVEAGAVVEDCVVMADTAVRTGARLHTAIVDEHCEIGRNAVVGAAPAGTRPRPGDITIVGRDSRVGGAVSVPAGSRLEPGTTA